MSGIAFRVAAPVIRIPDSRDRQEFGLGFLPGRIFDGSANREQTEPSDTRRECERVRQRLSRFQNHQRRSLSGNDVGGADLASIRAPALQVKRHDRENRQSHSCSRLR